VEINVEIALFALFSGITISIGGFLSYLFENHVKESPFKKEIIHTSIAFGGGIILSAVALVLVPKGMETLELLPLSIAFALGAVSFYFIDRYIHQKGGKMGMLLAMLMDFIPESIALGALFMADQKQAMLLAIFIGLQNLPEAFNSFRELVISGYKVKTTHIIFAFLSLSGVVGALAGHFLLQNSPQITALIMVYASGGIIYLLFQDIAPESTMKKIYLPPLGATAGFLVGMIGEKVI
tara:strand:- start:61 stop:774 length:714 start_codon:yes stop_codon:yes gene_type:complete